MIDKDEQIQAMSGAIKELKKLEGNIPEVKETLKRLEKAYAEINKVKASQEEKAWLQVELARKMERPRGQFYIENITTNFFPCHGDRMFKDDAAIIGGIATIGEHTVTLIANNRGSLAKENMITNFGMAHPEGYRKALRLMKQAEKFHRPIICLIDTPGAYCGIGAEERGQGEAIARNLLEMSKLNTPIIAGVIGEGGSGGALALGVADKIFMQEHAIYSILSPEGFASILWKDTQRVKEAAVQMKITAQDLLQWGIIDDIIIEPGEGAHIDPLQAAQQLKTYLISQLEALKQEDLSSLKERRYQRFRSIGKIN